MRKIELLIILSLLSFCAVAQTDSIKSKPLKYSFFGSPTYTNRILKSNSKEQSYVDLRNDSEEGKLGLNLGLSIEKSINRNWALQFGLGYSNYGFKTKPEALIWTDELSDRPTDAHSSFDFKYIDLSFGVKCYLIQKEKVNLFLTSGISLAYFMQYQQNNHWKVKGSWKVERDPLNFVGYDMINVFLNLQPGIEFYISQQFSVIGGIDFRMALKGVNSQLSTTTFLHSLGPRIGVSWHK